MMDQNIIKKLWFLVPLFIFAYFSTLQWIWGRWFTYDSYYSHGILIPFISVLLIWQKRDVLKNIKAEPSPWGMRLFVIGIIIHLLSLLFRVYCTSGFSMIIVLAGFILYVYGKNILKEILFPLFFLVFMIPLPLVTVIDISFQLKLLSTQMATAMLNVINIPAVQHGSYIRMDHASIVVEDVCSGLRSLIALTALGALFAYWLKAGKVKKTVLFLSSIPIALVTNMLRIMALAIVSEFWGTKYVPGLVEDLSGLSVFVLAFLLLSQVEKLLE
jgi:exosortase